MLSFKISTTLIINNNNSGTSTPAPKPPSPPILNFKARGVKFRARCQQQQILTTRKDSLITKDRDDEVVIQDEVVKEEEDEDEEDEEERISGIEVPRQRYISVSKSRLLSAILSSFFHDSPQDFTRFSSCLDSIIHAEHKAILEEMRIDYFPLASSSPTRHAGEGETKSKEVDGVTNSTVAGKDEGNLPFGDLRSFLLSSSLKMQSKNKIPTKADSSIAIASRFQHTFLKLLQDAEFEELSARDLLLTSALNTDYLLTLPINVDWKRAAQSNTIIFRRGYATERQKGLLIGEKFDYLQSKFLQVVFLGLSKPLGKAGMLIKEAFESASQKQELQSWIERLKLWLKESFPEQSYSVDERINDTDLVSDQQSIGDLPIWHAAQRAVPRYEGLLSSVGPRGRLFRKLLTGIGLIASTPKTSLKLDSDDTISEHYLRPRFLSRISLGDIWKPATREHCGNDFWKMLKTAISILFSRSVLQEPAFRELILLFNEDTGQRDSEDTDEVLSLKLKIYERIPIPDLPVNT